MQIKIRYVSTFTVLIYPLDELLTSLNNCASTEHLPRQFREFLRYAFDM